jgi:hypothetical protein
VGAYPLYAMPPKPEWVWLTIKEINDLSYLEGTDRKRSAVEMAYAVEAKLKEKNHG